MWNKLADRFGEPPDLEALAAADDETLREAGLSRQKAGYARSLASLVLSGELDLAELPADDEEAIALLTRIKGIGRWSAEIYLLFAEGRGDVWPAGDLAVQIEIGKLLGLDERPSEKQLRELAEAWRPHRGAAAVLAWQAITRRRSAGFICAAETAPLQLFRQPAGQVRASPMLCGRAPSPLQLRGPWSRRNGAILGLASLPRPTRKLAKSCSSPPFQR